MLLQLGYTISSVASDQALAHRPRHGGRGTVQGSGCLSAIIALLRRAFSNKIVRQLSRSKRTINKGGSTAMAATVLVPLLAISVN